MAAMKPPATTATELRSRAANLREMAAATRDDRLKRVYNEQAESMDRQAEAIDIDQAPA
jgi:hypothetical protein